MLKIKKTILFKAFFIIFIITTQITSFSIHLQAETSCETAQEIQNAFDNVEPGDTIIITPGEYEGYFEAYNNGTSSEPIVVKSENPDKPAILTGEAIDSGYGLHVTGDHWKFRNLTIQTSQKGIMLDDAHHNLIYHCEIHHIGDEAVHFRDGSSNNTITKSKIYNTGNYQQQYGEGVYVGSFNGHWDRYDKECDNNIISHCIIGPDVTAEHIDIKEGTTGNIIEHNTFYGSGISGANFSENFVDIKGNETIIRHNTGYREENDNINMAFKSLGGMVDGWGHDNKFYGNEVHLDTEEPYVITNWEGSGKAWNNIRIPEGNMYEDGIEEIEIIYGDINQDGKINIFDAILLAEYIVGSKELTPEAKIRADLNDDGIIDIMDIILLCEYIVGGIDKFPVEN